MPQAHAFIAASRRTCATRRARLFPFCVLLLLASTGGAPVRAEDGYDLWLRYRPIESPWLERYRGAARELIAPDGPARTELLRAIPGLLGIAPSGAAKVT